MKTSNAHTIGACDARARFSELLERVAHGEEFTITRHGSPVAKLVPVRAPTSEATRRRAIEQMRELASRNRLAGLKVKDLIAEGRR